MKLLGTEECFDLAFLLEGLNCRLDYMPTLRPGQKLIACGSMVAGGTKYLTICETDCDVELMNTIYDELSWFIMPALAIGLMISKDEVIIAVAVLES